MTVLKTSSAKLTTGVPMPIVVTFTTGRAVAFIPCTPSAMSTPAAIGIHW